MFGEMISADILNLQKRPTILKYYFSIYKSTNITSAV